jgi:hypothetical protein
MRIKQPALVALALELLMPVATAQDRGSFNRLLFEGVEHKVWAAEQPEEMWVSDGVVHMRRQLYRNTFEGTCGDDPCTLDVPIVANLDLGAETGSGRAYGTFQYIADNEDYTWGDRVGTFDLVFWAKVRDWGKMKDGEARVKFAGLGSGDFSGMLVRGRIVTPENAVSTVRGKILDFGRS